MFMNKQLSTSQIKDGGGSSFIAKSGIYDVILKTVSVTVNEHGARALNFNVEYNGNSQVFYGLKLDNNDGTENFQANIFFKLCTIAGLVDEDGLLTVSSPEIETHNIGKDNTPTDLSVLTDFSDLPVKMRIQNSYKIWEGAIKENKDIKGFFREDGASAQEITEKAEIGKQLEKDTAYATKDAFKDSRKGANDAPTPEAVAAWIAAKSGGSNAPAKTGASAPTKQSTPNAFAGPQSTFPKS